MSLKLDGFYETLHSITSSEHVKTRRGRKPFYIPTELTDTEKKIQKKKGIR